MRGPAAAVCVAARPPPPRAPAEPCAGAGGGRLPGGCAGPSPRLDSPFPLFPSLAFPAVSGFSGFAFTCCFPPFSPFSPLLSTPSFPLLSSPPFFPPLPPPFPFSLSPLISFVFPFSFPLLLSGLFPFPCPPPAGFPQGGAGHGAEPHVPPPHHHRRSGTPPQRGGGLGRVPRDPLPTWWGGCGSRDFTLPTRGSVGNGGLRHPGVAWRCSETTRPRGLGARSPPGAAAPLAGCSGSRPRAQWAPGPGALPAALERSLDFGSGGSASPA